MFPWKTPDIRIDPNYQMLASNFGIDSHEFWAMFEEEDFSIDEELKDLIESMLAYDPTSRPTLVDVLAHDWMRENTDTKEEFSRKCASYFCAAKAEQKERNEGLGIDYHVTRLR